MNNYDRVDMIASEFLYNKTETENENDYDFTDFSNEIIYNDFGCGIVRIMDTSDAIKSAGIKEAKFANTIFKQKDKWDDFFDEDDFTAKKMPEFMW